MVLNIIIHFNSKTLNNKNIFNSLVYELKLITLTFNLIINQYSVYLFLYVYIFIIYYTFFNTS